MRPADQVAFVCRVSELAPVLSFGVADVHVITDSNGRAVELYRGPMDDVAPEQQSLLLALDHIHGMSGRVAIGGLGAHAGDEIGIAVEWDELTGADVGGERCDGSLKESLRVGRGRLHIGLAQP